MVGRKAGLCQHPVAEAKKPVLDLLPGGGDGVRRGLCGGLRRLRRCFGVRLRLGRSRLRRVRIRLGLGLVRHVPVGRVFAGLTLGDGLVRLILVGLGLVFGCGGIRGGFGLVRQISLGTVICVLFLLLDPVRLFTGRRPGGEIRLRRVLRRLRVIQAVLCFIDGLLLFRLVDISVLEIVFGGLLLLQLFVQDRLLLRRVPVRCVLRVRRVFCGLVRLVLVGLRGFLPIRSIRNSLIRLVFLGLRGFLLIRCALDSLVCVSGVVVFGFGRILCRLLPVTVRLCFFRVLRLLVRGFLRFVQGGVCVRLVLLGLFRFLRLVSEIPVGLFRFLRGALYVRFLLVRGFLRLRLLCIRLVRRHPLAVADLIGPGGCLIRLRLGLGLILGVLPGTVRVLLRFVLGFRRAIFGVIKRPGRFALPLGYIPVGLCPGRIGLVRRFLLPVRIRLSPLTGLIRLIRLFPGIFGLPVFRFRGGRLGLFRLLGLPVRLFRGLPVCFRLRLLAGCFLRGLPRLFRFLCGLRGCGFLRLFCRLFRGGLFRRLPCGFRLCLTLRLLGGRLCFRVRFCLGACRRFRLCSCFCLCLCGIGIRHIAFRFHHRRNARSRHGHGCRCQNHR